MSEEDYKQLLAEHQREMDELRAKLDNEKDRQKRVLKDRVRVEHIVAVILSEVFIVQSLKVKGTSCKIYCHFK